MRAPSDPPVTPEHRAWAEAFAARWTELTGATAPALLAGMEMYRQHAGTDPRTAAAIEYHRVVLASKATRRR